MITIAEEILLLVLDYDTGRLNFVIPDRCFGNALGGALLMDLALNDRIDTDPQELFVVNPEPLGEPVLDRALELIATENGNCSTDRWVHALGSDRDGVLERLIERLVERRVVIRDRYDRLLVLGGAGRDVRRRIAGVLMSNEIPDPRDIMIISLADTCELWCGLMDESSQARLAPKICQIANMDLIGQAVARVMTQGQG